jgi:hypothetical protein
MSGFKVLMNADFTPAEENTTPPGQTPTRPTPPAPPLRPGPTGPAAPLIFPASIPNLTIPVNNNTATIPIQCAIINCAGLITLQNTQQANIASIAKKGKKKPKIINYGSASFSLKAGSTEKIKVKLNSAGRKLTRSHKTVKVWANIHLTSGSGTPKSTQVTLKR